LLLSGGDRSATQKKGRRKRKKLAQFHDGFTLQMACQMADKATSLLFIQCSLKFRQ
jgi:hypothetical protein